MATFGVMIYGLSCDVCGRCISWKTENLETVSWNRTRTRAKKEGWTFGKQDKCPNCSQKKRRDA